MAYRNIMVAVDGSKESRLALADAIELARDSNARLTIVHVAAPPPSMARTTAAGAFAVSELEASHEPLLRAAVEKVPKDLPVTSLLIHGAPAQAIVGAAKEYRMDLIVIGSHGRGRVGSALLGSVSQAVVHDSPVPVLVVHASERAEAELARETAPKEE
jgi:nucleotide-binding universal stress UspA family protein